MLETFNKYFLSISNGLKRKVFLSSTRFISSQLLNVFYDENCWNYFESLYTVTIHFEEQFLIAKIKTNIKIVKASLLDYKQLKFVLDETRIELVSFNYSPTFLHKNY